MAVDKLKQPIRFLLVIVAAIYCCNGEKLDMTHQFDNNSLYWPNGQAAFNLDVWANGLTDKGYWYQGDDIETGLHAGTHMDAPCHFFKDVWCTDEIPLDNLIAPGVFINIRQKAEQSPDTNLTLDDVRAWEADYGRIPDRAVVFQCSGWSDRYPNKTSVFGTDKDDASDFHFPGFDVEAVKWLVEERSIVGIGSDTPSTDWAQATHAPVHVYIGSKNVYGLENVKGTCEVPPNGSTVYVFPMFIKGSSGAATRIVAIWDTVTSGTEIGPCSPHLLVLTILLAIIIFI